MPLKYDCWYFEAKNGRLFYASGWHDHESGKYTMTTQAFRESAGFVPIVSANTPEEAAAEMDQAIDRLCEKHPEAGTDRVWDK